ncbi:MAG TPA: class I SAM-dependent methyltransferase [Dongiaceae bacterium]
MSHTKTPHADTFAINLAWWDGVVETHVGSRFYRVAEFLAGEDTLNPIESAEIGDVRGKRIAHLQCHFGLDTLSLARRGASVRGLDFSPNAVAAAKRLAAEAKLDVRFVESNVYEALTTLGGRHDIVYVTWGAINWLPDLHRWAKIVADLLEPGGFLYLLEGHPMALALEQKDAEAPLIASWPYFKGDAPMVIDEDGTYSDRGAKLEHTRTHEFPHALSEIFDALLQAGLALEMFHEHDSLAWQHWPCLQEGEDHMFRLPKDRQRLPLAFSLKARKPI